MKFGIAKFFLYAFISLSLFMPAWAEENASDDDTAKDDTQVYHLYSDIDLVSTLKFQYGIRPKIFVKSVYPQLSSDNENINIDNFNQLVTALMQQEITTFKKNAKQNINAAKHLPKTANKNDLYIDYDTSAVESGQDHLMSVRFTFQAFMASMAHPYHYHRVINYNLDTGEEIELADLFAADSNYLEIIAEYSRKVLNRRLIDKKLINDGTAPKIENYKNWNIKPRGLLITFDEYQVAPYVNGAQTVLIPYSVLREISADDSPISGCLTHRKKCKRTNLLTGGFIDEAINTQHRLFNPPFRHG